MQKVNVAAGKISGFISKLRAVKETNYYQLFPSNEPLISIVQSWFSCYELSAVEGRVHKKNP